MHMSRITRVILIAALSSFDLFAGPFDSSAVLLAQGGQPPAPQPLAQRAPDALERVTWRTRTLVGDGRLTQWKFAVPADGVGVPTFLDAIVRADAAVVDFVEGSSVQKVSADIQKALDWNLTSEERAAIRGRMGTIKILSYRVDSVPRDAAEARKLFAFAKAMGVDTIVTRNAGDLAAIDVLAAEFAVKVALLGGTTQQLEGRSKQLGIGVDTGTWTRDRVASVKDRLIYLRLRDARQDLFNELNRLNVRPLAMTLDTAGVVKVPGDLFAAIEAFENAVQPAYGANFTEFSKTRPIRWDVVKPARGETLSTEEIAKRSEEVRKKIEAAIPRHAYATPKKKRRMLVIESLHGMSHDTIPLKNVMLERMGKITGAWETEFSNDLNNLKYPKIKDYDGIFLNDIVGEFAAEPAVREGLARFVREGGGMAGMHGTPWASRNWDEFAEMIGAQSAPHRIEQGVMKVYDRVSPLMKPFQEKDINFREEYYRFNVEGQGRLRWDKVRVLMTVELDNPAIEPRPWTGYKRPDNVYPVSWIRNYGKGRVFYSSLGHMAETFMTPEIVGHFLAGIQFMLGDLEADATPNAKRD
jgi:type 1 glutamine amidotransferase